MPSTHELLEGIRQQDRHVLRLIYREYYPVVKKLILSNQGAEEDAQDVFQDALSMMYEKLQQGPLLFQCGFKTYLYAVARNMWLMVLRKRRTGGALLRDTENEADLGETLVQDMTQARRKQVFSFHLRSLGEDCQRVLKLFFEGRSLKEIAEQMGFTAAYAKKRKFVCQQKLIASIEQDALFKELTEY